MGGARDGTCFSLSKSEKASARREHRPWGQRKLAQKGAASWPGGSGPWDEEAGVAALFPLHTLAQSTDCPIRDQRGICHLDDRGRPWANTVPTALPALLPTCLTRLGTGEIAGGLAGLQTDGWRWADGFLPYWISSRCKYCSVPGPGPVSAAWSCVVAEESSDCVSKRKSACLSFVKYVYLPRIYLFMSTRMCTEDTPECNKSNKVINHKVKHYIWW